MEIIIYKESFNAIKPDYPYRYAK